MTPETQELIDEIAERIAERVEVSGDYHREGLYIDRDQTKADVAAELEQIGDVLDAAQRSADWEHYPACDRFPCDCGLDTFRTALTNLRGGKEQQL